MALLNRTKTYTFKEFGELQRNEKEEKEVLVKVIEYVEENKDLCAKVVCLTAMLIHININVHANSFEESLDEAGHTIIDLFLIAARWASIGMGFKNMLNTILSGGNMKDAINDGIQYILAFLFFQLYPQLFDIFKGIKLK